MTADELPPDPFADSDVDLWELEQAELLARQGNADDVRWDRLDGPLLEDFDPRCDPDGPAADDRPDMLGRLTLLGVILGVLALALAAARAFL